MQNQSNFIKTIMENDYKSKKHETIITRFPPEPNGFLHMGHARAVIINFELAKLFNGYTNLRFDDTNPEKEDIKYVESIKEDIKWLGYEPKSIYFASDYFDKMYEQAIVLIKKGLAYVDDSSAEIIAKERGNVNTPGVESKYRNRSIEENLKLFTEMKEGKYNPSEKVLRAKIDMKSPNMNMRDPVIYRISHEYHYRQKDKWHIYPLYDFAHPLEDAFEGITHSLCSLEFEDHRPLYDWFVDNCDLNSKPRQIEFGRLNIEKTVLGKRYLRSLVEKKLVFGWDDPRMPTLKGLKRRGFTPDAIRNFILDSGLSKTNGSASLDMLEHFVRDDLSKKAPRVMSIKDPLLVKITNYPKDFEEIDVELHPDLDLGTRKMYFGKEIYIEREDFLVEKPNNKYKRLYLNGEVRLMHAYFIKCTDVIYNEDGTIKELHATYDVRTKSGSDFNERKPNGTIHFVEKTHAILTEFREVYSLLDDNDESDDYLARFNNDSLKIYNGFSESYLKNSQIEDKFQFVRLGYFCLDKDTTKEKLVFNCVVQLKSSFK